MEEASRRHERSTEGNPHCRMYVQRILRAWSRNKFRGKQSISRGEEITGRDDERRGDADHPPDMSSLVSIALYSKIRFPSRERETEHKKEGSGFSQEWQR